MGHGSGWAVPILARPRRYTSRNLTGVKEGIKAVEGLRQLEIVLKRASVSKDLGEFRDFLRRVKSPVV